MFVRTSIHDVTKVVVDKIKEHEEGYCILHVTVETKSSKMEFVLFSDTKEELEIKSEKE
jgi:hypothetical protein